MLQHMYTHVLQTKKNQDRSGDSKDSFINTTHLIPRLPSARTLVKSTLRDKHMNIVRNNDNLEI